MAAVVAVVDLVVVPEGGTDELFYVRVLVNDGMMFFVMFVSQDMSWL